MRIGGFWDSMRAKREEHATERQSSNYASFKKSSRQIPVARQSQSTIALSKEASGLQVDQIIEHDRFGRGVVVAIEDTGGDKRAFVNFDSAGQKQLLLKYAKFKIVK